MQTITSHALFTEDNRGVEYLQHRIREKKVYWFLTRLTWEQIPSIKCSLQYWKIQFHLFISVNTAKSHLTSKGCQWLFSNRCIPQGFRMTTVCRAAYQYLIGCQSAFLKFMCTAAFQLTMCVSMSRQQRQSPSSIPRVAALSTTYYHRSSITSLPLDRDFSWSVMKLCPKM